VDAAGFAPVRYPCPAGKSRTDWLAGKLLKGYNRAAQSMTELSAAGSPTRSLVVPLTLVAAVLMLAFGIGVWRLYGRALLPRVVAGLVIGNAIAGLVATLLFPPDSEKGLPSAARASSSCSSALSFSCLQ